MEELFASENFRQYFGINENDAPFSIEKCEEVH